MIRVLDGPAAVRRAARESAQEVLRFEGLLAPGLVNAHAHLELSTLHGRLPRGGSFAAWIAALLDACTQLQAEDYRRAVLDGAVRLARSGTTTVGDIAARDATRSALGEQSLRGRVFREVLDANDPERTAAVLERLTSGQSPGERLLPGVSPHAPYTVSDRLLQGVRAYSAREGLPVSVHWAETEEERAWCERGEGPFADILEQSSGGRGLERLQRAGLLNSDLSLVHANCPRPEEVEQVAAAGACVIHCPGAQLYFERPPFPFDRWQSAGVPIALGTDSLAGNEELDMRREMALLRTARPELAPLEVWRAATTNAARALGMGRVVGALHPGAWADWVVFRTRLEEPARLLDAVTAGSLEVEGVWIGGRRLRPETLAEPAAGGAPYREGEA